MYKQTCCFFGHRKISETEELKRKLYQSIEQLILEEKVETFLFGSKSRFDALCLETVTKLKKQYPHIKRVYVRAEYPNIRTEYEKYLLNYYEETYFPEQIVGAGRAVYVERNREMIKKSQFCIVYYDQSCTLIGQKSGTELALQYAKSLKKKLIYFP